MLYGERAVLRPLQLTDAGFLAKLVPHAGFPPQHLPIPNRAPGWNTWVRNRLVIDFDRGAHFVQCTPAGEPVGYLALRGVEAVNRKAEVLFAPSGSSPSDVEALHLLLRFGFVTMNLNRVYSWLLAEQPRLLELRETVGFQQEGRARAQYRVASGRLDALLVGLLRAQFRDQLPAQPALSVVRAPARRRSSAPPNPVTLPDQRATASLTLVRPGRTRSAAASAPVSPGAEPGVDPASVVVPGVIRGQHAFLRPLEPDDGELIYRWLGDAAFRRDFQVWPMSRASCQEWVRARLRIGEETGAHFVICDKDEQAIGYAALRNYSREHRRAEFLFAICDVDRRQQGAASEAARLLCRFGFHVLQLDRIYAWVLPYKKWILDRAPLLGFCRDAVAREHVWFEGDYSDMVLISVLREEFVDQDPRRLSRKLAAEALFLMIREVLDRDLPVAETSAMLVERIRRAGGLRSVTLRRGGPDSAVDLATSCEPGGGATTRFTVPITDGDRQLGSLEVELDEKMRLTKRVGDLLTRLSGELVGLLG